MADSRLNGCVHERSWTYSTTSSPGRLLPPSCFVVNPCDPCLASLPGYRSGHALMPYRGIGPNHRMRAISGLLVPRRVVNNSSLLPLTCTDEVPDPINSGRDGQGGLLQPIWHTQHPDARDRSRWSDLLRWKASGMVSQRCDSLGGRSWYHFLRSMARLAALFDIFSTHP